MDEVKGDISEVLLQEKRQKAVEQFLDGLWKKARVEETA